MTDEGVIETFEFDEWIYNYREMNKDETLND